jgi:hypothetical protein
MLENLERKSGYNLYQEQVVTLKKQLNLRYNPENDPEVQTIIDQAYSTAFSDDYPAGVRPDLEIEVKTLVNLFREKRKTRK